MSDMVKKFFLVFLCIGVVAVSNFVVFFVVRHDADRKIIALQSMTQAQLSALQSSIARLQTDSAQTATVVSKVAHQQETQKEVVSSSQSQDQLLTQTVAKVMPAVVSIVISKDVPQLEVVYENPFKDDPFFRDMGINLPVYRQKGTTRQKVGGGSGFIVTRDGYIVTNRHVVSDTDVSYTVLLSDGNQKDAKVVYKDSVYDIAILKINGQQLSTIALGNSNNLKLGQSVIAIGNALAEYNNSVSVGIISGLNRTITAQDANGIMQELTGVIQTDAAINPGNSGGPLIDMYGRVVGVNVAMVQGASSIGFSVPIDSVKSIIERVVNL